jgi:hypothetical protein
MLLADEQCRTADPRATGRMEIFQAARAMVDQRKASGYEDRDPQRADGNGHEASPSAAPRKETPPE